MNTTPKSADELVSDAKAAWYYWNELAENPDTDPVDINAAGKDYYAKQKACDDARAQKIRVDAIPNRPNSYAIEAAEKIVHLLGVGHVRDIDHYIEAAITASQPTLTFSDALRIARGCLTGTIEEHGFHRPDVLDGIQTVINALEAEQQKGKSSD